MELFIVRALMDTYPTVLNPSSSNDVNRGIPLDQIAIYPAAHTDDNVPSIADGVREARAALTASADDASHAKVLIHDVDNGRLEPPIPNFSGTAHTHKLLEERGVVENVEWMPGWHDKYKGMNSLNEMEKLVLHCRDSGVKALVVVSTPYHIPRSFLSALSVASRLHPDLLVYAKAAKPSEGGYWSKVVAHSQGTLVGSRDEFVASEMERIQRYTDAGDLITVSEALRILRRRDKRTS